MQKTKQYKSKDVLQSKKKLHSKLDAKLSPTKTYQTAASCSETQKPDHTAFFTPSRSYLLFSLHPAAPPPLFFFFLNGMKVEMAGIQDHHAWDLTDGER